MTNKESITVTTPIAFSKCLVGVVSDYGGARISFGFNPNNLICYGPNISANTFCNIIMIGI